MLKERWRGRGGARWGTILHTRTLWWVYRFLGYESVLFGCWRFGRTWCLRSLEGVQGDLHLGCLNLDDGGSVFVRNPTTQRRIPRRHRVVRRARLCSSNGSRLRIDCGVLCSAGERVVTVPYGSLKAWRFELYTAHARRAVRLSGVIKSIVGFALQERIWSVSWIDICCIISVQLCSSFGLNFTVVYK